MVKFRCHSTPEMKARFMGLVKTFWSGAGQFLNSYYERRKEEAINTPINCFKALIEEILKMADMK